MTPRSTTDPEASRCEIWRIRFDPTMGAEMGKMRPAVVVSVPSVGRLPLRLVVPVTGWDLRYETVPWLVYVKATARNGLDKDSAADCFQVKSVSLQRFVQRLGIVTADEIEQIAAAVALCVGA